MAKTTTSNKRKKSDIVYLQEHVPFTSKELKDSRLVAEVLLDCIKIGDIETFREVLIGHILTVNKTAYAKKCGIGRRTLYDLMDFKKEFNPELSTVAAIFRALAA